MKPNGRHAGRPAPRLAVIGAGWAGLGAAVRGVQQGFSVTLYEMAAQAGGRARGVVHQGQPRDNGQHILIGAYLRTLNLMQTVGVDTEQAFKRLPLALLDARGNGLRLPGGPALLSFAAGVLAHGQWSWKDRLSLLSAASSWLADGFRCEPDRPVAQWAERLPASVRQSLLEPLCVAALNTPAELASTSVLLRVLRDALFSAPGSADLLLPRCGLHELLPRPALRWLEQHGAMVRMGQRAGALEREGPGWRVVGNAGDAGDAFDAIVLACSPGEAARLVRPFAATWAQAAESFGYEPIITAWLDAPEVRFPYPMLALTGGPAQFAFDLGGLDTTRQGELTLACSGARTWTQAGRTRFEEALHQQVNDQLAPVLPQGWQLRAVLTEKRATFSCTPGLVRPSPNVWPDASVPSVVAVGDYVQGPYPATLEGAVRSGESAIRTLGPLLRQTASRENR